MIIDEMLKLGLNVLTGDLIGADFCHDEYPGGNYCPEAVVEALSTEDVATVMKLCHETGIPVTVRGAGTGQVGGAVPVKGGIVLSVKGMNKVLDYADGIPNLKGKLAAKKAVITTITADDIPGLDRRRIGDPGSPTKVPRMFPPVMPEPGVIIDEGSVEASVAKLMQLIKDAQHPRRHSQEHPGYRKRVQSRRCCIHEDEKLRPLGR